MKLESRPTTVRALGTAVACLLGVAVAGGQARPGGQPTGTEKPPMAEEVFKNVQVLKGIPEGAVIALGAINAQPLRSGMDIKVVER